MYSSTGLVNQIILDALADWAVQAGRNQINQIFVKYPRFSSNKFIFLTLKPQASLLGFLADLHKGLIRLALIDSDKWDKPAHAKS